MPKLFKLTIPPGLMIAGTEYEAMGRYLVANFARWARGVTKPIGGWVARTVVAMDGKARAMIAYIDDADTRLIVIGTNTKLYALTQSLDTPADITPSGLAAGDADASAVGGYGAGPYGSGAYGTPRADVGEVQPAGVWTMATLGQYWYGVPDWDGDIYRWQNDVGVDAAALGGDAPTGNSALVVHPYGYLVILGAEGVKRRVQWADLRSDSVWIPTSTNLAGDFDIQTQGRLMCGVPLLADVLIGDAINVHLMRYEGLPGVFKIEPVGENCGPISRGAMISSGGRAYWWSPTGFYMFDGGVIPIPCECFEGIMGDMNFLQRSKITSQLNSKENEVTWKYPSGDSVECDRECVLNYAEGHWNIHDIGRTCGIDSGVFGFPIKVKTDGIVYDHEVGANYQNEGSAYLRTAPLEIGDGDQIAKVSGFIPDALTDLDNSITFYIADSPMDDEEVVGPFTFAEGDDVRFAARQAKVEIDLVGPIGVMRLDLGAGGKR